jgi:hypothetical protein
LAVALSLTAAPFVVAAQPARPDGQKEKVTPSELLANEAGLSNKPVTVEGVLSNQGTNYFTDLQVVLKDGRGPGQGVIVQPWLPIELPPSPAGAKSSRPTLSDYLGKRVVLDGVLTDGFVNGVGTTKVLRVDGVRIVE